jgi:hypothetical protein
MLHLRTNTFECPIGCEALSIDTSIREALFNVPRADDANRRVPPPITREDLIPITFSHNRVLNRSICNLIPVLPMLQ